MPGQSQTVAETSGQWELAVEGISERWMEWTRLAEVGLNASPGDQRNLHTGGPWSIFGKLWQGYPKN